jgi:hypothetical protein
LGLDCLILCRRGHVVSINRRRWTFAPGSAFINND